MAKVSVQNLQLNRVHMRHFLKQRRRPSFRKGTIGVRLSCFTKVAFGRQLEGTSLRVLVWREHHGRRNRDAASSQNIVSASVLLQMSLVYEVGCFY